MLLPSILGATILLFGNAFSAYATAYALTGGAVNLVPLIIGQQIGGDVLSNPHLGQALAFGMIVVIAVSMVAYALLQRRAVSRRGNPASNRARVAPASTHRQLPELPLPSTQMRTERMYQERLLGCKVW